MKNIINEDNVEEFKNYILKGKTILELMNIYNCTRTTITSSKKKYGLVGISPNNRKLDRDKGSKKCLTCGQEKTFNEFYSNGKTQTGKVKYKPTCRKCENVAKINKANDIIREFLYFINKTYMCEVCGYYKNTAALEFHHKKESEKEYEISKISKSLSKERLWKILEVEIPKCIILCANCHREWHNPNSNNY